MQKVTAEISDSVFENISEEIKLGIFPNTSEAINSALKKAYAQKSRGYLRRLIKSEGIAESSMLKELEKLRK